MASPCLPARCWMFKYQKFALGQHLINGFWGILGEQVKAIKSAYEIAEMKGDLS